MDLGKASGCISIPKSRVEFARGHKRREVNSCWCVNHQRARSESQVKKVWDR